MDQGHLLDHLVLFGRYLRGLGIPVAPRQVTTLAEALAYVDLGNRADFQAAAQAILVTRQEHILPFQQAFRAFWQSAGPEPREFRSPAPASQRLPRRQRILSVAGTPSGGAPPDQRDAVQDRANTYSARELLRRRDFARLDDEERTQVRRLMLSAHPSLPLRRTRRAVPGPRGWQLDMRATWRHNLRHGGEILSLRRRRRQRKPRPLVLLCDISGSMERYARVLLQLGYVLGQQADRRVGGQVETFVFGTRLTRLTRRLRQGDVDRALREAATEIQDWGGGTRIGQALKQFNYEWGRRVLRQGAVVLIVSDGFDRGDVDLLAREMARLQRSCHRVLWLNPLLGSQGFQPLVRGMLAALPFVDEFLPAHNLASLDQLLQVLHA